MKITITEGLVLLKTLDARIKKETDNGVFVVGFQKGKLPVGFTPDEFVAKAKSTVTSIKDLIKRRNAIKSAIVESNARTTVNVGGVTYTVASAIERKTSIVYESQLRDILMRQYNQVSSNKERSDVRSQEQLESYITNLFGKTGKTDPDIIKTTSDAFWKENAYNIVDPIGVINICEKMNNEIQEFIGNIDIRLSISNSTTEIDIPQN